MLTRAHALHLTPIAGRYRALQLFLYGAIFVGISGQTLGKMIVDVRVVTTRFVRPSPAQAPWRYAVTLGPWLPHSGCLASSSTFIPTTGSRTRFVFGRRSA